VSRFRVSYDSAARGSGKGEVVDCTPTKNSELFFAVLGGLGQFGIITKARIVLEKAPQRVRWMRALYTDFATFKADQELLISAGKPFDYVEGFVVVNEENPINGWSSVPFIRSEITAAMIPAHAGAVMYCLEVTKAYSVSDLESLDQVIMKRAFISFPVSNAFGKNSPQLHQTKKILYIRDWETAIVRIYVTFVLRALKSRTGMDLGLPISWYLAIFYVPEGGGEHVGAVAVPPGASVQDRHDVLQVS